MAEEEAEMSDDEADSKADGDQGAPAQEEESVEAAPETAPAEEAPAEEAPAKAATNDADYASMTVAELKELLKAAGKPVSGKKADLVARLSE
jgi:hypothetical protein